MGSLQTALDLLKEEFGEFDNVKLLLAPGSMTPEEVSDEILEIAQGIRAGKFKPQSSFPEGALEDATVLTGTIRVTYQTQDVDNQGVANVVPEAEIEVTDAMMNAGLNCYALFDSCDPGQWVVGAIYVAMEKARRGSS